MPGPSALAPATPGSPDDAHRGVAHAKALLIGEHAVLHGAPAVGIPVTSLTAVARVISGESGGIDSDLYTGSFRSAPMTLAPVITAWRASLAAFGELPPTAVLQLRSTIPVGRGLGSSAATAAAVIEAVARTTGHTLTGPERFALIQTSETVAHGTASGVDATAVMASQPFRFQRGEATPIAPRRPIAFVIADTGVPGSTGEAVAAVRSLRERSPQTVDRTIGDLAVLADDAAAALADGAVEALGAALHAAHALLRSLGVSTEGLDTLARAAESAGSSGAKLTGGGRGGCMIAVSPTLDTAPLEAALRTAGAANTWTTTVGEEA